MDSMKLEGILREVKKELARIVVDLREYEYYAKEHKNGAVFYAFVKKIRDDLTRIIAKIVLEGEE